MFNRVEATKPLASRASSAEIYVACLGYKAPSKIDPRLLDPKHLFEQVEAAPKVRGGEGWREMGKEGDSRRHDIKRREQQRARWESP